MDLVRMERLRQNVAMIEARDRDARLQVESPNAGEIPSPTDFSEPASGQDVNSSTRTTLEPPPKSQELRKSRLDVERAGSKSPGRATTERPLRDPWVPRSASDEPAPWLPRAAERE